MKAKALIEEIESIETFMGIRKQLVDDGENAAPIEREIVYDIKLLFESLGISMDGKELFSEVYELYESTFEYIIMSLRLTTANANLVLKNLNQLN